MAVAVNKVAQQFLNVQAGVAIPVAMQVFEASDIRVIYGITSQVAVQNVDYTISLANDLNTFTIVPTASLIAKIDALIIADPSEQNYITVRRELDLLTESTAALSRYTPFTSREHDRSAMRDQQLNDRLNRSLQLGERFVGGSPLLTLAELEPDRVLIVDPTGTQLIAGPNADEIENAQAYAERAEAAAALVSLQFESVAALLAWNLPLVVGKYISTQAEGYTYYVEATGSTNYHVTTAFGNRLRALPRASRWEPEMFAVNGSPGVTNMTAALQLALNTGRARINGVYRSMPLVVNTAVDVEFGGTITRHPSTATGSFIVFNADVLIDGRGKLDLNKENTTTGCHGIRVNAPALKVGIFNMTIRGAKAVSGWGDGITISTGQGASSDIRVAGCTCEDNDGAGISGADIRNGDLFNNRCLRNGGNGIFLNNFDQTFTQKIRWTRVRHNLCSFNVRSGIGVGNFIEDNNISSGVRLYGFNNMEATDIVIEGNTCESNGVYGIAVAAINVSVLGNTVRRNGTEGMPNGGILSNSFRPDIHNNVSEFNIGYGIDTGGSNRPSICSNVIAFNTGTALSVECTTLAYVHGNKFIDNGSAGTSEADPGSTQIHTWKTGGDGNGNWFPNIATQPHIAGNQFVLSDFRVGIRLDDGLESPIVCDNIFWTQNPKLAVRDYSLTSVLRNNRPRYSALVTLTLDGTVLNVPDIMEEVAIAPASSPTITGIRTESQRLMGTGVSTIDVVNGGSGYPTNPTVTISGGGGSGAAGTARVRAGAIVGIIITARGSGYTSPPTVTVSGGTGATFTTDYAKRSPGQDRPLKLLTFTACTIAGVAADGPNVIGIPAGNISVPANGHITLRGRGEQWRVESKNF